ncbi:MAG: hypothetical protein D6725_07410 [Planctomycetota bacterium]|nr:MAG: hypothetical protein D6725_07410 [Planctomycetota bacterium]
MRRLANRHIGGGPPHVHGRSFLRGHSASAEPKEFVPAGLMCGAVIPESMPAVPSRGSMASMRTEDGTVRRPRLRRRHFRWDRCIASVPRSLTFLLLRTVHSPQIPRFYAAARVY